MSDNSELRTYLQSHPKTLSALFGLTVALSAAGPASQMGWISGP